MRLYSDGRRLDTRAISRSVFRIGLAGEITRGPSVVAPVLDDVDVFGREVIAQIVAIVVATPQLARRRIERHADGVAQTPGEDTTARAVGIELRHRGAHRVALVAEITGRPDRQVQLAVGSKQNRARGVPDARPGGHARPRCGAARIEALHVALLRDIHRIAAERDAERPPE